MRKMTTLSIVLASMLFTTIHLSANEVTAMSDSVAKKESKALADPKMTKGAPAAKAKIEEEQEKRNFDTKMDRSQFNKDAANDKKKLNGENKAEINTNEVTAMSDSVAKKESKALADPKMTKGAPAAKAKIEEEQEKRNFDTKMDRSQFNKDAANDKKKLNGENKAEINTIEKEQSH